jgi:hypothetical protein
MRASALYRSLLFSSCVPQAVAERTASSLFDLSQDEIKLLTWDMLTFLQLRRALTRSSSLPGHRCLATA